MKKIFMYASSSDLIFMDIGFRPKTKEDYFNSFKIELMEIIEITCDEVGTILEYLILANSWRKNTEVSFVFVFDFDGNLENKYSFSIMNDTEDPNDCIGFDINELERFVDDYSNYFNKKRLFADIKLAGGIGGLYDNEQRGISVTEYETSNSIEDTAHICICFDYILTRDGIPYKISFNISDLIAQSILDYRYHSNEFKQELIYDIDQILKAESVSDIKPINVDTECFERLRKCSDEDYNSYDSKKSFYLADIDLYINGWGNLKTKDLYLALQILIYNNYVIRIFDDDGVESIVKSLKDLRLLLL